MVTGFCSQNVGKLAIFGSDGHLLSRTSVVTKGYRLTGSSRFYLQESHLIEELAGSLSGPEIAGGTKTCFILLNAMPVEGLIFCARTNPATAPITI